MAVFLSVLSMLASVAVLVACKRAILRGMNNIHLSTLANICFLPLGLVAWFFSPVELSFSCWVVVMSAAVYSMGWFFQNMAIQHSDVTMVAPLLGSKSILVAIIATIWLSEHNSCSVLFAAGLVILGVYLVSVTDKQEKIRSGVLLLILLASLCYAICDAAATVGLRVLPILSLTAIFLITTGLIHVPVALILLRRISQHSGIMWAMVAGILMVLASYLLFAAIKVGNNVTIPNIIVALRSVFALPCIWVMSKYFKVTLEHQSRRIYIWRVVGGLILFAATTIVILR